MPVLKVKKNGVWEEVTGGFVPDNLVYTSEDNQESTIVPLNADTLGGNLPAHYAIQSDVSALQTEVDDLQEKYNSSCYYARFGMSGDQTIATEKVYQDVVLERVGSYGSFFTLSSDGKTITMNKKMVITVSGQLYFYSGHATGKGVNCQINKNGSTLCRAQTKCVADSPYETVAPSPMTIQVVSGDTITLQAYSDVSGGIVKDYNTCSYLNIDVKGIIE